MLDAVTLDQLRAFVTVAEAGSFRAAARRLARVQSAVSQAVANLEAELGVCLFDRSAYRPALTPPGRALLADARAILGKTDRLRARARGLCRGVELDLAIAADTLFSLPALGAALGDLRAAYPTVGVRLTVAALGGPIVALRERRCTLAIMVGEDFRDPGVEFEALAPVAIVAVVSAQHPLAAPARRGEPIDGAALADHLQIVLEDPTPLSAGREFDVLSPGTWRVSGQEAKLALIRAGVGWGTLPLWAVERDLAAGLIVRLPAAGLGQRGERAAQAYLAHRTDEPLGPAAQALREALLRRVAGDAGEAPDPNGRRETAEAPFRSPESTSPRATTEAG